jgi:hypothetical protein
VVHASSISRLFLDKILRQEMGVIKGGDVLAAV